MCRKIAFFGLRAEIILSSDKVSLESRAGPFLGVCRNIGFPEKYSPLKFSVTTNFLSLIYPSYFTKGLIFPNSDAMVNNGFDLEKDLKMRIIVTDPILRQLHII